MQTKTDMELRSVFGLRATFALTQPQEPTVMLECENPSFSVMAGPNDSTLTLFRKSAMPCFGPHGRRQRSWVFDNANDLIEALLRDVFPPERVAKFIQAVLSQEEQNSFYCEQRSFCAVMLEAQGATRLPVQRAWHDLMCGYV